MARLTRRTIALVLALALVSIAAVGCSGSKKSDQGSGGSTAASSTPPASTPATDTVVTVTDKGFSPATVTIKPRSRVIWQNHGKQGHNVTFADGLSSGNIPPGQRASHVFSQLGSYPYSDTLHPSLKGTVNVQ